MPKTLYLIDGHAHIYAAYYAPMRNNLTSPEGEPTKAVYIFTTILLKLLRDYHPDMIAVAMDARGKTFRHELYPDYKANRPAMPEDLPSQITRIDQLLKALGIPMLRVDGYEADDIIGTLARQAAGNDCNTTICSKDKDLEQLIAENVTMLDVQKDIRTDLARLLEKKGIRPEQVIDILALQGDSSDNIPGVPDVGPKTALQWIQQYGSLDELLNHADEIKGKRGNSLRAYRDQALLSRQLATICCQAPLSLDWDQLTPTVPDREQLTELFDELGFQRLRPQIDALQPSGSGTRSSNDRGKGLSDNGGESSAKDRSEGTATPSAHTAEAGQSANTSQSSQPAQSSQPSQPAQTNYHLVDTAEAFQSFLEQLSQQTAFAIDTETTDLNPVKAALVGISIAWQPHTAWYLPFKAPMGQPTLEFNTTAEQLGPILADPEIKKVGQNIKYDSIILHNAGLPLAGIDFDTMIAAYILDATRSHYNLDALALDYLGHETIKLESLLGKGKNALTFDMVDTQLAADYAAEDADVTWRLKNTLEPMFQGHEQQRRLFDQVEIPLIDVLARMELNGVKLDIPYTRKLANQLNNRLEQLRDRVHELASTAFNLDSPKQLAEILFQRLELPVVKKTKQGPSTDQDVLEELQWQHELPRQMLEYRQLSKLLNTYLLKLPQMVCPRTGRIHASFNQTMTATGRLSSNNPNLQNIPIRSDIGRNIRRAFVAESPETLLLGADYSQVELRMLAHFAEDPALIEAFQNDQDIHRTVAAQIFDIAPDQVDDHQRAKAKGVNFGIIYGQTAFGLAKSLGIDRRDAQAFIDGYFETYPTIHAFMDRTIEQAREDGYVTTILGRRRTLPEINSGNTARRNLAQRMAVNTVIQGSAADLIKIAMINIHRQLTKKHPETRMILQVHDELVFELPRKEESAIRQLVQHEMEHALALKVSTRADIGTGDNWLDCK